MGDPRKCRECGHANYLLGCTCDVPGCRCLARRTRPERQETGRTGAISTPFTMTEAELMHQMNGRWPTSRMPVERYLDPSCGQKIADTIEQAAVRRVPEGHPLRPLIGAIVARHLTGAAAVTERKGTPVLEPAARPQRR
jgi:hypothetical protein